MVDSESQFTRPPQLLVVFDCRAFGDRRDDTVRHVLMRSGTGFD
jgi:hypothetical protein